MPFLVHYIIILFSYNLSVDHYSLINLFLVVQWINNIWGVLIQSLQGYRELEELFYKFQVHSTIILYLDLIAILAIELVVLDFHIRHKIVASNVLEYVM